MAARQETDPEVVAEADRVKWSNADLDDIRYHLTLFEEACELRLKRANEMKDPQRVQNREVRLRDLYVTKFIRLFAPLSYACSSPGMGHGQVLRPAGRGHLPSRARSSLAAQMMEHTSKPIHLSR